MKKIVLIFLLLFFSGSSFLFGQVSDEVSILNFVGDAKSYIDQIENDYYIINKLEFDLVTDKDSKSTPVWIYSHQSYKIVLFGETGRIVSIGLKIKTKVGNTWTTIKDINNPANILNTDFKPTTTGFYEFEITASRFASGYTVGRYCLIISYE